MLAENDFCVSNTPQAKLAKERLQSKINVGKGRALELARHCAAVLPRDHYVWPENLKFYVHGNGPWELRVRYKSTDGKEHDVCVHNHAMGQMSGPDVTGVPKTYVNKMVKEYWRIELLAEIFNTHFKQQEFLNKLKQPKQFLTRLVELDPPEMRGFLTQSYNRHLASPPLLAGFLDQCRKLGARPVQAYLGDVKVGLYCFLPWVFEPIPGEYLAIGVYWQNGDFGGISVKVTLATMRVFRGTVTTATEAYSRIHIGSIIKNTDLELDDEAAAAEVDAVVKAMQSGVRKILQPESIQCLMDVIAEAAGELMSWDSLSNQLKGVASKEQRRKLAEMLSQKSDDLPPPGVGKDGKPLPSRWWASSALSWLSENEPNPEKSQRLQTAAGNMLTPNAKDSEEAA